MSAIQQIALALAVAGIGAGQGLAQELSLIHISEPTRLGMISYAVFCLKKKKSTMERETEYDVV